MVAGHDPSGGAGVDADREALAAAGAIACALVATATEQDERRVRSFAARPKRLVARELREALARGAPAALKTGLLVDAGHVRLVAALARRLGAQGVPVVVDPVLVSSSGTRFVDGPTRAAFVGTLLAAPVVVTPNLPEAAELLGLAPEALVGDMAGDLELRFGAARRMLALGARAVVLKGGHGREDPVRDLVLEADAEPVWCEHPRVAGGTLHGSGCRFASFLAGRLAAGDSLVPAVRAAGRYVAERIREAPRQGA